MSTSDAYKIRPAGRHILTVGRDLIQDNYAAVVELVKNAYDADSQDVVISFTASEQSSEYTVIVEDHGHGMSRDTVINKWMVPSTDDKLLRQKSPSGRTMQGRKGVGRYAASILGNTLLLETISTAGEKTTLYVEWDLFEDAQYLDDVEILIETINANPSNHGTKLTISGDNDFLKQWDGRQFSKLRFELKKLISPSYNRIPLENEKFDITLKISGFNNATDLNEDIRPYPIIDLYDYRIHGAIDNSGIGTLSYTQQKTRNSVTETISVDLGNPTECGNLNFDIRVYDREKEAIDSLIARGLKDEYGHYVEKLQARKLLNEYNGVGVYRNGFRIRPLGDADFDWLKLNEQRVQNPSLRVGSNQVIGYVEIQSEELSGLIEKSARDGLKENNAFAKLKDITKEVINRLEYRRFEYRRKAGLSRSALKVEREIERIFSFDELKKNIHTELNKRGVDAHTVNKIRELITNDEEEKNKSAEEIRQAVAIYQGQATLGKIINVILHEGRRPLNFFKNQIPILRYWYDAFLETSNPSKLEYFMDGAEGVAQNAEIFVRLFSRLDPLAAEKQGVKLNIDIQKTIRCAMNVFGTELEDHNITINIIGDKNLTFFAREQDIYTIFTNLADNSIYWMTQKKSYQKIITIDIVSSNNTLQHIDFRDTGPGIEPSLIESQVIFEPQFSTKPDGTGLGLAIAGEAATRCRLDLHAFEDNSGAWFRLQTQER